MKVLYLAALGDSNAVAKFSISIGTAEHLTPEEYATLQDQQEQQADDE